MRCSGSRHVLPLNPRGLAGISPDGAFNTAVSFTTNTNWQWYSGEAAMSNLSQMLGLTIHNFTSAATGIALAFALFRGFARPARPRSIGNFWADVTRVTLYLLLPVCFVYAIYLIASGVPQTLASTVDATTLEGAKQTLVLGPVAGQEAIKMLGTNGGGFFNANSAHPFENPTAWTNLVQMLSIFALGVGLTYTFGKAVKNTRQGWALLAAMLIAVHRRRGHLLLAGSRWAIRFSTTSASPVAIWRARKSASASRRRLCSPRSPRRPRAARSTRCTTASPRIGGLVPLFNIQLGEIVIGGVGSGIYGFLLFALLAVFVAGLMVGRTPEYVGKKIEAREVKLAVLAIAVLPLSILGFTALSAALPAGLAGPLNKGPHGFAEILYALSSATGNNGSAFAGLTAGTPYYNGILGIAMWVGRFFMIVPMLAIAGSLAAKKYTPATAGSFPTTGPLWVGLLIGIILILGGLTFLPSLALGPIADHLAMIRGQLF